MSTQTPTGIHELVEQLPPGSTLTLSDVSWEEYEDLLEAVGEAPGLRVSYDEGKMEIMTVSSRHESLAALIERMMTVVGLLLRIKILFFGSATMRKRSKKKGNEPDACFYIQSAELLGNKIDIDFESDPPPDIAVEVDVHHKSTNKFGIYAALGISELWLYDQYELRIYHLEDEEYIEAKASLALPVLTSEKLTEFLRRSHNEDQHEVLLAFEKWLTPLKKHSE